MLIAKKIKIISAFLLSCIIFSCAKQTTSSSNNLPYVAVNVVLYPNDPGYFKIQAIGGWVYYGGAGINGLIIYRKTTNDFIALERASTFYPDNAGALAKVQTDNFTCKDTISGSKWQIVDGAIISGPATYPMRKYQTTYDGNALRIFN